MRALTTVALLAAIAAAAGGAAPPRNTFAVQAELQSLYDEDSAAALQFFTPQDVDDFHSVLCTEDWFFLDAAGQRHVWSEVRDQALKLLTEPRATSISQPIGKISLTNRRRRPRDRHHGPRHRRRRGTLRAEGRTARADGVHKVQGHVAASRGSMEAAVP